MVEPLGRKLSLKFKTAVTFLLLPKSMIFIIIATTMIINQMRVQDFFIWGRFIFREGVWGGGAEIFLFGTEAYYFEFHQGHI